MRLGYKRYAVIIISAIVLIIGGVYLFRFLSDKNKLTTQEKRWISDNRSNVTNVSVLDDLPVFGKNGSGVFYDFLKDFSDEYNLKINPVTYKSGEEPASGVAFKKTNKYDKNNLTIYRDHYVVISKVNHFIKMKRCHISDIFLLCKRFSNLVDY